MKLIRHNGAKTQGDGEKAVLTKVNFFRFKRQISCVAFALPFLIVFLVFFIYPFFSGIRLSFMDKNGEEFVWFDNYVNIFANTELIYREEFLRGLSNTLLFVVISVPCLILVPLLVALLLEMQPPGYKIFRAILFMPTVFSISSVILMWRRVLETETGFINALLIKLGLGQIDFIGSQPWAWIALLIVTIWWTMGTNMVILGAGLKNIDKTMYEAAELDGATGLKSFWYITLPSLKGQLVVVAVMTVLASFNLYGQPKLLTNGGPNRSTTVLLMYITDYIYDRPNIASAMALSLGVIMIAVSVVQMVVTRKKEK